MIYFATNNLTPRLEYVLSFIFHQVFDADINICRQDENRILTEPCIYYGEKKMMPDQKNIIFIPAHNIMNQKGIHNLDIDVKIDKSFQLPYFFSQQDDKKYDLPFDLFALIFYLISRYEEYLPHEKDTFGRYKSTNSLAVRNQFIKSPLIDLWLFVFWGMLKKLTNSDIKKKQNFSVYSTLDIDSVWAYAYKGSAQWKGAIKDLVLCRFSSLFSRWKSGFSPENDPFYTFEYIDKMNFAYQKDTQYFVLFSKKPNKLDINHKRNDVYFKEWLVSFAKNHNIGLHPSFQSHKSVDVLKEEKLSLEKLTEIPVMASRQHYILWTLPDTYRALLQVGIQEDYSMGYADMVGYRASTGYTFYWYDILEDKQTSLLIFPFQIMDVTMKKYMKWSSDEALLNVKKLITEASDIESPVRFIWHNSSFFHGHGWGKWQRVFEFLLSFKKTTNLNNSTKSTN